MNFRFFRKPFEKKVRKHQSLLVDLSLKFHNHKKPILKLQQAQLVLGILKAKQDRKVDKD